MPTLLKAMVEDVKSLLKPTQPLEKTGEQERQVHWATFRLSFS
jgi:hypothetical protein